MKQVDVRLNEPGEPQYLTIKANYRGEYVAIHRELSRHTNAVDPKGRWQITHIPTGMALWKMNGANLNQTRNCAKALDTAALNFTDPKTVNLCELRERVVEVLEAQAL